jgi:hypothetical protein
MPPLFLYGIDAIRGTNDSPASMSNTNQKQVPSPRYAFLLGIAGIPQRAKSACDDGTSKQQIVEGAKC